MFRSTFSGKSFAELTFYPYFNQRTTVQLIYLNALFLFQPEDNSSVCLFVLNDLPAGRKPTGLLMQSRRTVDLYKHWLNVYDWEI